ncbi:MAG: hypothetical protein JWO58_440 [Chitinophagaceae bacterium]|nr:hypothetical protein [Chitinophagaceae bacterium]
MKSNFFFTRLMVLVFLFAGFRYAYAGIEVDSIRPLTKVNKEFLIVAHIIMSKDSVPGISQSDIINTIASVNNAFAPIGVSFKVCEFRYIYNYNYNFLIIETPLQMRPEVELMAKYNVKERINMYFADFIVEDLLVACGIASLGGVYHSDYNSYNYTGVWIVKDPDCLTELTVAHELGHYFSLKHPFDTGSGPELVNGSNCSAAGDNVCDTPADPYHGGDLSNYITPSCTFIDTEKDANGEYYDPDVSNIMSYYSPCVCLKFSHDQYEKMAQYYLSNPLIAW